MQYLSYCIEKESTLADGEYILLVATLEGIFEPNKFSCQKCITQYGTSAVALERSLPKRKSKGCFDTDTKTYRYDNLIFKKCLGNYKINIDFYLTAFSLYDKGVLPFKGNLYEQPAKVIEIFDVIASIRDKHTDKG
jgi:hypothetical protein